jgi:hypothetical protein
MGRTAHGEIVPPRDGCGSGACSSEHESITDLRCHPPRLSSDALQPVLSIRASVPRSRVPSFIRGALHEIRVHIEEHHIEIQGPPFSICRPAPHSVDVEVGWPVSPAPGTDRISSGALPAHLARGSDRIAREAAASGVDFATTG